MPTCASCSTENPSNTQFCETCGQPINSEVARIPTKHRKPVEGIQSEHGIPTIQTASHKARQKVLDTTAGKSIAVLVVLVIIVASVVSVTFIHRTSPARGTAPHQARSTRATPTQRTSTIGVITEFTVPASQDLSIPGRASSGITTGPDGNLWFTENNAYTIGRITPSGTITEFAVPSINSAPNAITAGPDGNLWFTEYNGNNIGRITPNGSITEFAISPFYDASALSGITAGPDGNLWFTEGRSNNNIGRITPSGTITKFTAPIPPISSTGGPSGGPSAITTGPDGNLWFTIDDVNIERITPNGTITVFVLPTRSYTLSAITTGPDGNLWFTGLNGQIGRITPSGKITAFGVPFPSSQPDAITTGPDGNLWFTEDDGSKIGRMTSGV